MKRLYLYIRILIVIVMLAFLLFNRYIMIEWERRRTKKQEFHGVITKKIMDYNRHASTFIIINDTGKFEVVFSLYDSLKTGDSIYKKRGETQFRIIRHGVKHSYYPVLYNQMIYEDTLINL